MASNCLNAFLYPYLVLQADLIGKLYKLFDSQNIYTSVQKELSKWLEDLPDLSQIHLEQREQNSKIPLTVLEAEKALTSPHETVRSAGIKTLREFDHITAIDALARAVNSPMPDVSIGGAFALSYKTHYKDEHLSLVL